MRSQTRFDLLYKKLTVVYGPCSGKNDAFIVWFSVCDHFVALYDQQTEKTFWKLDECKNTTILNQMFDYIQCSKIPIFVFRNICLGLVFREQVLFYVRVMMQRFFENTVQTKAQENYADYSQNSA